MAEGRASIRSLFLKSSFQNVPSQVGWKGRLAGISPGENLRLGLIGRPQSQAEVIHSHLYGEEFHLSVIRLRTQTEKIQEYLRQI